MRRHETNLQPYFPNVRNFCANLINAETDGNKI